MGGGCRGRLGCLRTGTQKQDHKDEEQKRKRQRAAAVQDAGAADSLRQLTSSSTLSALLLLAITGSSLLFPSSAHAQGGVPLWTNVTSGGGGGLAVDSSGNVFVGGAAVIKYSGAGTPLWTNHLAHAVYHIAVDKNGNAFATDYRFDGTNHSVLLAYSRAGVPLWTNLYGAEGVGAFSGTLALDGDGNVVVTGFTQDSPTNYIATLVTIKYSNDGTALWTNRYARAGDTRAFTDLI